MRRLYGVLHHAMVLLQHSMSYNKRCPIMRLPRYYSFLILYSSFGCFVYWVETKQILQIYKGTNLNFTLPGLSAGDVNVYILKATNGMGESTPLTLSLPIAAAPAAPPQPVILGTVTLRPSTASLDVSLTPLSDVEVSSSAEKSEVIC